MTIRLPQAQVLVIRGPDAVAFAQAQFASDLRDLATGAWQWSAWLSAQGRVRALFRLLRVGDETLHALLSGGTAADLLQQLSRFVFRSKLALEAMAPMNAAGTLEEAELRARLGAVPNEAAIVQAQGMTGIHAGGPTPRWLLLGSVDAPPEDPAALERWRIADIDAGIVELGPSLQDRFLPAALGLDSLGAVGVRKGCYPGQEIVARLHFKGGNKRWLHRLEFVADALPPPGLPLAGGDGAAAGDLLQSAWIARPHGAALAVLAEPAPPAIVAAPSAVVADFRVLSAVRSASA